MDSRKVQNDVPDRVQGAINGGLLGGSIGSAVLTLTILVSTLKENRKLNCSDYKAWAFLFATFVPICVATGAVFGALDNAAGRKNTMNLINALVEDEEKEQREFDQCLTKFSNLRIKEKTLGALVLFNIFYNKRKPASEEQLNSENKKRLN